MKYKICETTAAVILTKLQIKLNQKSNKSEGHRTMGWKLKFT